MLCYSMRCSSQHHAYIYYVSEIFAAHVFFIKKIAFILFTVNLIDYIYEILFPTRNFIVDLEMCKMYPQMARYYRYNVIF